MEGRKENSTIFAGIRFYAGIKRQEKTELQSSGLMCFDTARRKGEMSAFLPSVSVEVSIHAKSRASR